MTTAELIVRTLDLAQDGILLNEEELDSPQITWSERICDKYTEYKVHQDFTSAAFRARVEVVQEILDGKDVCLQSTTTTPPASGNV